MLSALRLSFAFACATMLPSNHLVAQKDSPAKQPPSQPNQGTTGQGTTGQGNTGKPNSVKPSVIKATPIQPVIRAWQPISDISALKSLKTVAETSEYHATSRESEVLEFLHAVDKASPYASYFEFGKTTEQRPLAGLLLSNTEKTTLPLPKDDPRLTIVIIGNIHSGECDGKEALLALTRDLLAADKPRYLDRAVIAIIPNFNADGNERVGLLHRPGQEGPDRGMGTRENAVGLDLNRDFIKLDTPEVRSLVRLIDTWDADVLIDNHTTNGSLHQYDMTYDIPHNPAANVPLISWMRSSLIPDVTKDMLGHGIKSFYYGNFNADHTHWESFGHEPRYSTEYMGLRGRIGILVESYSYATYQRRIEASYHFVDACLKRLTENATKITQWIDAGSTTAESQIPVRGTIVADDAKYTVDGYAWAPKKPESPATPDAAVVEDDDDHPHSPVTKGFPSPKDRNRKEEIAKAQYEVKLFNIGKGTEHATAPEAYFIPADCAWAASRVRMHGIPLHWFDPANATSTPEIPATQYEIASKKELNEFQNHKLRAYTVEAKSTTASLSRGWIVPTNSTLRALTVHLLEPNADDSLAVWNFFDPWLEPKAKYPVLRLESIPKSLTLPPAMKKLGLNEAASADMAFEEITLPKIYDPAQKVSWTGMPSPMPKFLPDQEAYLIQKDNNWFSVDCQSGAMQPFDRPNRLANALAKLEAFSDTEANSYRRRINTFDDRFENALIDHKNDLFSFSIASDEARQITHSPEVNEELAEMSPTGKHVAYIFGNNVWVANTATGETKQLTHDGNAEVLNGKLDWVYQEEIYGRGQFKGYWWSPDGTTIAYLRLNETEVPHFQIDNSLSFAQKLEETRYPKSGQPNPLVTLNVVDVETGKSTEVPLDAYAPDDRLVVRVAWKPSPAKQLVFQIQNRIQSTLDLMAFDVDTNKLLKLTSETSPAWVEVIDQPRWLPDGSFLWVSDSPNGRRHIFRISDDGKRTKITDGPWDVKDVLAITHDGKQLWFTGHRSAPANVDLLRVNLESGAIETVGNATGSHRASVHPSGRFYFDSWSDMQNQSQQWLRDYDGKGIRYVGGYRNDRFEYLHTGDAKLFEIEARDGFKMQAILYQPKKMDPNKKLPVLIHVYGGPAAPTVENTWTHRSDLWHRYMAEQGICVLFCDNRSALGAGSSDTWKIYKNLGAVEMLDLEDAVGWLNKQSWADSERIGIWGWSYGGYFTSYAMTHSKLFRAGIAGAPVTDWNNYDSVYTERFMDTPKNNPEGYKTSSVVAAAANLSGRLMIIHGEIDDNVHMANSMQLVHALQKAGKQFDLMVYPNNRHGVTDPNQSYHQYQMMTDFFQKHLLDRK